MHESHTTKHRWDLEKDIVVGCQEWYRQEAKSTAQSDCHCIGVFVNPSLLVNCLYTLVLLPPSYCETWCLLFLDALPPKNPLCVHPPLSVPLTISVCLSGDAPKAETAGLRCDQDTSVSQLSVASSMLQEQEAVHGGHHSRLTQAEQK